MFSFQWRDNQTCSRSFQINLLFTLAQYSVKAKQIAGCSQDSSSGFWQGLLSNTGLPRVSLATKKVFCPATSILGHEGQLNTLSQRLANSSCRGPDSADFRLCRPHGPCGSHSAAPAVTEQKQPHTTQQMSVPMFQYNFMDAEVRIV